jgi:membrane protein YdbS with pleckstrin-like domain
VAEDAFALAAGWKPLSPRLRALRRTVLLGVLTVLGLAVVAAAGGASLVAGREGGRGEATGVAVAAGAFLLLGLGGWRLIGRNYASWAYAERADDLLVRHGWLFRRLVVVPYGRMQFVDVTAGPLQRRFGVATLQLHTAAAATDATIPGLPPAEAARLRDTLAALGEARLSGL